MDLNLSWSQSSCTGRTGVRPRASLVEGLRLLVLPQGRAEGRLLKPPSSQKAVAGLRTQSPDCEEPAVLGPGSEHPLFPQFLSSSSGCLLSGCGGQRREARAHQAPPLPLTPVWGAVREGSALPGRRVVAPHPRAQQHPRALRQ